jgi:hypothetical protein
MEDFQKWALGLLFIIAAAIIYGQLFPPITKAPLFSTQASTTVLDLNSVRMSFNVSSGTSTINSGNDNVSVYSPYIKGIIRGVFVNSSRNLNLSVYLLDPFNQKNGTLYFTTILNGTTYAGYNYTRDLSIYYMGYLTFNITDTRPSWKNNGTMVFVDIIYSGV